MTKDEKFISIKLAQEITEEFKKILSIEETNGTTQITEEYLIELFKNHVETY